MMATAMDYVSEVHFKEKLEEEGVKAETASENTTIWFDFRVRLQASTSGHRLQPGQGTEMNDGSS